MGEWLPILGDAFDTFLEDKALSSRSFAGGTVKNLRSQLRALAGDSRPITAFDSRLCRSLMAERAATVQTSSLKTFWGALAAFGAWSVARGYLPRNPMGEIPMPRPREKPHRFLREPELRRLWLAAGTSRKKPGELRLILLLLLEGLRATELCELRWQDVHEDRIIVIAAKGGKVRAVPLRAAVVALLPPARPSGRIFAFSVAGLEARLKRLGLRAGVGHVHPHLLRHSFASLSLLAGMSADDLRVVGGWSADSKMLERYTRSVREEAAIRRSLALDVSRGIFEG